MANAGERLNVFERISNIFLFATQLNSHLKAFMLKKIPFRRKMRKRIGRTRKFYRIQSYDILTHTQIPFKLKFLLIPSTFNKISNHHK
jgi:hypothetical protein